MVLHIFYLNVNALFEFNVLRILPRHFPLQNIIICPVNGTGMSHVIRKDQAVDYQVFT